MIEVLGSELLEGQDYLKFLGIIWIYCREFSENMLKHQWLFSERFKSDMLKQLAQINNSNSDILIQINNRIALLKSKYNFKF